MGLFIISVISSFWLGEPKCTEPCNQKVPDLPHSVPMWPNFGLNIPSLCRCVSKHLHKTSTLHLIQGMSNLDPKWVRLFQNGKKSGTFSDLISLN